MAILSRGRGFEGDSERLGYSAEGGVSGPELRARCQEAGCDEVRVDEADALREEGVGLDHASHFAHLCNFYFAEGVHSLKFLAPIL